MVNIFSRRKMPPPTALKEQQETIDRAKEQGVEPEDLAGSLSHRRGYLGFEREKKARFGDGVPKGRLLLNETILHNLDDRILNARSLEKKEMLKILAEESAKWPGRRK